SIELHYLTSFSHGDYLELASEVVVHDPKTQRLFVVNSQNVRVDVLDIRTPVAPQLFTSIDASQFGGGVNSVDVCNGVVAVAIEDTNKQAPGTVAFYDTDGVFLNAVKVGPMPDMLKFSPDGKWLLTADEGEPDQDYTVDPPGSVSIINMSAGAANLTQNHARTVDFTEFNTKPFDPRIRVYGPNATPAQDFEPEYIAISPDSRTAWIVLQENNALAILDIITGKFSKLISLGFKDHNIEGNGFDASNSDREADIKTWPVKGMYQPDAIVSYQAQGQTYLLTANEGDPRVYDAFEEEVRVEDVALNEKAFKKIKKLQKKKNLGRLKITKSHGDTDGDGDYDELYAFGGRSFAIWTAYGELVYDSGNDFERITAIAFPDQFNSDNEKNGSFDNRSDDRGPEPEGLALAEIEGRTYVFIGLERIGGIMVYDITNPHSPSFVQYVNNRNFYGNAYEGTAGDLGPEGLKFIKAEDSPNGKPLLVVANEVSGTTSIFEVLKSSIKKGKRSR
ncbi:MAG: choice-of-anchor I family protein, partial [bacterium]